MIVKDILKEYANNKKLLGHLELELKYLKDDYDIQAFQISEKTSKTNKISDIVANNYIRIEEKISQYEQEIRFCKKEIEFAEYYFNMCSGTNREILEGKYKYNLTLSKIGEKVHLTANGVNSRIERILNTIQNMIDNQNL